jgi:hypothetical protein
VSLCPPCAADGATPDGSAHPDTCDACGWPLPRPLAPPDHPGVPWVEVDREDGPGGRIRLSRSVRVY